MKRMRMIILMTVVLMALPQLTQAVVGLELDDTIVKPAPVVITPTPNLVPKLEIFSPLNGDVFLKEVVILFDPIGQYNSVMVQEKNETNFRILEIIPGHGDSLTYITILDPGSYKLVIEASANEEEMEWHRVLSDTVSFCVVENKFALVDSTMNDGRSRDDSFYVYVHKDEEINRFFGDYYVYKFQVEGYTNGAITAFGKTSFCVGPPPPSDPTSVGNKKKIPATYYVSQNFPNPFNPTTTIKFALPNAGYVTVKVINIHGQEVATLVDGMAEAGHHSITWDASGFASGVYFYTMQADNFKSVKKMILTK